jgi:arginase
MIVVGRLDGMTKRRLAIIEAPSNLGLMALGDDAEPGTRHAPATLRQLGLHDRLAAEHVVTVEPPPYSRDDQRRINIRNIDAIAEYSIRLADAVEEAVEAGYFPLVLGGDCSILIGSMLGLARQREPLSSMSTAIRISTCPSNRPRAAVPAWIWPW